MNPNIPPPNGYVFRDVDGTLFKATSWKALERKVIVYRGQTGGNVTDVMAEIMRQVCETTPEYCKNPGDKREQPVKTGHKTKIMKYLSKVISAKQNNHLRYVSDSEAMERARICAGCPRRTHVDFGCQSCRNTIATLRKQALGAIFSRAPALGLCEFSECDLPVAIHVVDQLENDGRLPNFCWRKAK